MNDSTAPGNNASPGNNGAAPKRNTQKPIITRIPTRDEIPSEMSFPTPLHAERKARMRWFVFVIIIVGIFNATMLLTTPVGQRGLLAGVIGGILLLLLMQSPRDGIVMALLYLGLLGGLRRALIPDFGGRPRTRSYWCRRR